MRELQAQYSILTDRLVCWLFAAAFAALVVLMTLGGYVEGPDDIMRWVAVRDLQAGQGWFDPYQRRLGPGDGTLMHWSRLVDAPISVIYWLSSTVLPSQSAYQLTAFVWPTVLAGLVLWVFAVTGGALGARDGAITALVMGVFALNNSGKFDQFSFDHHGLQVLLFVSAVMFFVLRKDKRYAGIGMGICLALSMSVGTESLAQIALIGIFVAVDWILSGSASRRRTMEFSGAVAATLLLSTLATTARESFFFPGCDALTFSVALPVGVASIGFLGAAFFASSWSVWARLGCFLLVGAVALAMAQMFAPYCLENPINQMSPDMRAFWLSQVTEAQDVIVVFQRHAGETAALIGISVFSLVAAAVFTCVSEKKMDYLLLLCLAAVGFILFLYQSRMMTFLTLSMVAVQAQVLRVMYQKYRIENQRVFGVLMVLFVVLMSPKTGASLEKRLEALAGTEGEVSQQTDLLSAYSCTTPQAIFPLRDLAPGLILADFDYASYILRHTDHSVLAGNYHRNEAGNLAQIDLFRSEPRDTGPRLAELGINYILVCESQARTAYWSSVSEGEGFLAGLLKGELPTNVWEVQTEKDAGFRIFRVGS